MPEARFSDREKDLLLGNIQPESNQEYEFVQQNANAVVDEEPSPADTLPVPPTEPPPGPVTYPHMVAEADDAKKG